MNRYINLITDQFVLDFLNKEINKQNFFRNFCIDRQQKGLVVTFEDAMDDKITATFTDYYVMCLKTRIKALQKNWQIALTKKFGYDYLADLREELSENIRKKYVQEVSEMQRQIEQIKERGIEK